MNTFHCVSLQEPRSAPHVAARARASPATVFPLGFSWEAIGSLVRGDGVDAHPFTVPSFRVRLVARREVLTFAQPVAIARGFEPVELHHRTVADPS